MRKTSHKKNERKEKKKRKGKKTKENRIDIKTNPQRTITRVTGSIDKLLDCLRSNIVNIETTDFVIAIDTEVATVLLRS
jgi:acetolactate synthase regulatory subunit